MIAGSGNLVLLVATVVGRQSGVAGTGPLTWWLAVGAFGTLLGTAAGLAWLMRSGLAPLLDCAMVIVCAI